jgi:hypothetical protein
MFRKTDPTCKLQYEEIFRHENAEKVTRRLTSVYQRLEVFQKPLSLAGNKGILEIYPVKYPKILIKLEGPMFVLEDAFRILSAGEVLP